MRVEKLIIQNEKWADIPLLHIYDEGFNNETPIVIFLHGFMSGKEHNLHYAYNLVKQGVRVIMPDALYHGEREEGQIEAQLFWPIVLQNIAEVGVIYDTLISKGYIGNVALAGTSMGGITTAGCLYKYDWIKAAAILMGAVSFPKLFNFQIKNLEELGVPVHAMEDQIASLKLAIAKYDAFQQSEPFEKVPLFFWHGQNDPTVPVEMSYTFWNMQKERGKDQNIIYKLDQNAGHAVTREGVLQTVSFLVQHLA